MAWTFTIRVLARPRCRWLAPGLRFIPLIAIVLISITVSGVHKAYPSLVEEDAPPDLETSCDWAISGSDSEPLPLKTSRRICRIFRRCRRRSRFLGAAE